MELLLLALLGRVELVGGGGVAWWEGDDFIGEDAPVEESVERFRVLKVLIIYGACFRRVYPDVCTASLVLHQEITSNIP